MHRTRRTTIATLMLGAMLAASCTGRAGDELAEPALDGAATPTANEREMGLTDAAGMHGIALAATDEVMLDSGAAPGTALTQQSKLIREATLQLRVDPGSFEERWEAIRRIAAELGGYIGDASTGIDERDDVRYAFGTATVRVPAQRFDDAIDRFGDLGEQLSQSMSGTDVTEEYVDLEARLRHWRSVEEFTLALLDEATTIDEAITVQQRLNDIQLTVEQLEGRIRYLDARTDLATVTVGLTETPVDVVPVADPEPGPIAEAVDQAIEVLLGTVGFMIVAAAFLLPLSLVALALALVYRGVRRTGAARPDGT